MRIHRRTGRRGQSSSYYSERSVFLFYIFMSCIFTSRFQRRLLIV